MLPHINITDNHHSALVYLLGITRLMFTRSTAQEPSLYFSILPFSWWVLKQQRLLLVKLIQMEGWAWS